TLEFNGAAFQLFWEKSVRHLQQVGIKHVFTTIKLGQSLNVADTPLTEPDKVVDFRNSSTADSSKKTLEHFFACIRDGQKPVSNHDTARLTSVTALMLYQSTLEGGRQVTREEIEAMG
ncbi:MAG TPA: hypothetical protein VJ417_04875, partial [Candidatus Glassbacteria bacterium]|nr:hypothetical protein [Candidatus Glassbacteria bacterium]